jgi:hypothetical protein
MYSHAYSHAATRSLLALALAAAIQPALAAPVTVVDWRLTGQPGDQATVAANSAAAHITGSSLTRGPGLTGATAANSMNASGWHPGEYFEFGFTVATNYYVDLDRLYLGTRSSATGPGSLGLFWSGDGFSSTLFTFNQAPGGNFVNGAIDLAGLRGLTGAVNFRIRNLGNTAANGGTIGTAGTFRVTDYFVGGSFDRNMQLTGTVNLIPLPAAGWLLGSALLGMTGLARRQAA